MRRREVLALLGSAAAWPLVARAQYFGHMRLIGVLMSMDESDPEGQAHLAGFTQALSELGWTGGRNLQMEVRWGSADINRIRTFAKELAALQPDLIVSQGTPVTAALLRETRAIPIVFVTVTDPVGDGFVAGLARPGGNMTGFLTSESAITAKMLELLREIAPGLTRIAMLFNPDTAPGGGNYYLRDLDTAANFPNRAYRGARSERIRNSSDFHFVGTNCWCRPHRNAGLLHAGSSTVDLSLAAHNKVPTIYPWKGVVTRDDGLVSYGPDLRDIVRRGAPYVDQILRGAKPADLPVQVPVKFDMAVNVKTAKALALTVPPSILLRADEVVE